MIYYIYKIVCEDTNTDYTYVGSTRAFKERKYLHKSICNNENRADTIVNCIKLLERTVGGKTGVWSL